MSINSSQIQPSKSASEVTTRFDKQGAHVSSYAAAIGVTIMLGLCLTTIVEIFMRATIGWSIAGFNEIVAGAMAIGIAACLPVGVAARGQLKIDFFSKLLPERIVRWLELLGSVALFLFFASLTWGIALKFVDAYDRGSISSILRIPQWPILFTVSIFMGLSAVVQSGKLAVDFHQALKGKQGHQWITNLVGPVVAASFIAVVLFLIFGTWQPSASVSTIIAISIGVLICGILLSIPINVALMIAGVSGISLMLGSEPALSIFSDESYAYLTNSGLAVLPFFLLMGAFAGISGMAADIYRLAFELLKPIRGGLAHATIVGCAGFGALTGSSLATVATFGKIALPEMEARNYSTSLAGGAIAAGGTLGALIPPSVLLIIYGILVEESVGQLMLASFVPAFIGVGLYLIAIAIMVRVSKNAAPRGESIDWVAVRQVAKGCWAALALFGIVWGGLYAGYFTDTEAACVGAVGTFGFAVFRGRLRLNRMYEVMAEVSRTLAMIFPLIFGAVTFSFLVALTQIPDIFAGILLDASLTPFIVIMLLVLSYLVMGMVMDSFAIMFITAPVYSVIIAQLGYDPIWWGIITVVCVEIGVISPPFGMNLFVLRGVAPHINLVTLYRGVLPFCAADILKIALLVGLPWLIVS